MGTKQNDRALICKVVDATTGEDDDFEIGLRDMQWLQWLIQHLHVVKINLAENIEAIRSLRRHSQAQLFQGGCKDDREQFENMKLDFLSWLDVWKQELMSKNSDLYVLMKCAKECSHSVSNILATREK
jgi:hypothetical protein